MLAEREASVPPPDAVDLIEKVASTIEPDDGSHGNWVPEYARVHGHRLAFDLEIIRKHVDKKHRILEYGAAPVLLTGALKVSGYDVTGLDLAPERLSVVINNLGLDVRKCDIETERAPFSDSEFDVAIFNELFEHLRINPIFTMKEVCRVLKPGGMLMLSTPNLRSLGGLRNLLLKNLSYSCCSDVYDQYRKLETLGHMGHVREYTSAEVAAFLQRCGFRIKKIIWRGNYGHSLPRSVVRFLPSLRPFFSLVAIKE